MTGGGKCVRIAQRTQKTIHKFRHGTVPPARSLREEWFMDRLGINPMPLVVKWELKRTVPKLHEGFAQMVFVDGKVFP